jgi:hypothetical protein
MFFFQFIESVHKKILTWGWGVVNNNAEFREKKTLKFVDFTISQRTER